MPPSRRRTDDRCLQLLHGRVAPSPFPQPARRNLRKYLHRAHLPPIARSDSSDPYHLPPRGRKSHKNRLRVKKDPQRLIDEIRQYEPKAFDGATKKYHKFHIYGEGRRPFPGKYYAKRPDEALVLESHLCTPEGTSNDIPYPCSVGETCAWLTERPFKTMQRAMHLAFPDTTRWWLEEAESIPEPEETANRTSWRTYVWRFHPDEHQKTWWRNVPEAENGAKTEPAPRDSMVFVVQPPWILALQDMINFTKCTSLPSLPDDEVPPESQLNTSRRVWANLLDTCKRHECQSFVLTTYHGWAFGSFSKDWTSASISQVKDFDAKEPNVMQSLVYWVACSMGLAGAEHPAKKVEETKQTTDVTAPESSV